MSPRPAKNAMSFEQATARLEEIVARMDDPATGMEQMIALAEEGMALIRSSKKLLAEAELKIRKLEAPQEQDTPAAPQDDNEFTLL